MSGPFGSSQWMYASGGEAESQSLRFNDDDSAYLSRTPASAGNRKTWTWSGWVKRGNITKSALFTSWTTSGFFMEFSSAHDLEVYDYSGSYQWQLKTSQVFRDVSSWYHIVLSFDSTQATAADRVKIYVNNEEVTSFSASTYPSLNYDSYLNQAQEMRLGNGAAIYSDIYLAEVNFVDGTALDPTSFGETDANGQWVPIIEPSVTYGTNGFYLPFLNGIGDDESGNSNDWTANNIATTDIMLDSPTNNFSTMNPLASSATLSEGNLRSQYSGSGTYQSAASTMSISSGKWYVELRVTVAGTYYPGFGIADITTSVASDPNYTSYLGLTSNGIAYYTNNGFFTNNAIDQSSTVTVSSGDIIGIAIDLDSAQNTYKIYQNGTLAETYNINAPANAYAFCESTLGTASAARADWNFGQDSSFHGLETAQGNQDGNGKGDFYYEPPSGYLALCTDNLPDPDIADGSEHFNTVLWTGNGTQPRSITGVGFQPDFVWMKNRSAAYSHQTYDAVRGTGTGGGVLYTNQSDAVDDTYKLSSFDTDGVTLGSNLDDVNNSGNGIVGWFWKANGSGVSNTDGSVSSTVSANTTAGFSIVTYAGNQASDFTIGHGLSSAPDFVITKGRSATASWGIYYTNNGVNTNWIVLNSTGGQGLNNGSLTGGAYLISGASTLQIDSNAFANAVDDMVAYCFHNVDGFSKFGSYTGNGSSNGTFVYTGFRPAFVIIKRSSSTGSWYIHDSKREGYNGGNDRLQADQSDAEFSQDNVDILSNGFKLITNSSFFNGSGNTFIYMAFAENPFKYSNAR